MFMFNYDYFNAPTGIIIIMLLTIIFGVAGLTWIVVDDIKYLRKKKKRINK